MIEFVNVSNALKPFRYGAVTVVEVERYWCSGCEGAYRVSDLAIDAMYGRLAREGIHPAMIELMINHWVDDEEAPRCEGHVREISRFSGMLHDFGQRKHNLMLEILPWQSESGRFGGKIVLLVPEWKSVDIDHGSLVSDWDSSNRRFEIELHSWGESR